MKALVVTGVVSTLVAAFVLATVAPATGQDYVIPLPELTGQYYYTWGEPDDLTVRERRSERGFRLYSSSNS